MTSDDATRRWDPQPGRVLEGYVDLQRRSAAQPARDSVVVRSHDPFPTIMQQWRLGSVGACLLAGGRLDVAPLPRPASDDDPPDLILGYVVAGSMEVSQRRRRIDLGEGSASLYESASPAALHAPGPHRYLVAQIPGRILPTSSGDRSLVVAHDLTAFAAGRVLTSLLVALAKTHDLSMTRRTGEHLGDALVACTRALMAEVQGPSADRSQMLFAKLVRWVDAHLGAEVTAETLAAAHFVSSRHVRKVFADQGTSVSQFVRHRRLERIRQDLRDPALANVPVSAVASRWGLREASVFSRAFSGLYGQSPSGYREDVLGAR